jgi:glycosyltransferase involved in cell wall biosynthesis
MRFCMVTTFYPPYHSGGCATYVRALSRTLVDQGHEVEVIHCIDAYRLRNKHEPTAEAADDGIVVHRLESRFGFLSPLISQQTGHPGLKSSAERAILAKPFDVVNFHNISLIGGPAILSWSRAPVTLYTLHEHWLLCPTHFFWKNRSKPCDRPTCFSCCIASGIPPQLWRYTTLVQRAVAHVDVLLAPSEYTAARHRDAGLPRVKVLPLFSAITPPSDSVPRQGDRPRFLFVGRLVAAKGIVPLLEEFALLPAYDLLVIGDGELRGELESRFATSHNIRFLGHLPQSELVPAYQEATALIFPTLVPETFGLTIVEAFACGTPVIVHDVGGSRELVDETGAGFVYRNREELRAALSQLAANTGLRERLGRRARESFLQSYTPQQHLKRYLEHVNVVRDAKGLH